MIEVFMLVSLILCFSDVLMQCYLHYYGPPEDSDAEEENNYPDLPVTTAGAVRSSSAAARDIQGLLSVSGYVSKMESDKGVNNNIIKPPYHHHTFRHVQYNFY